ncbi:RagB/SusD family nutrient uptake outer membrane protein [Maribacter algicola]|uniref:RagB/SusD family nutrient uptake outer membrane protein n=1 Tax=Meishania litoralis TaxID=3434685 RepID=A0ACC7LEW3_9FLAO
MKNILIIVIVAFLFISCSNELDLAPISTPSAAGYFANSDDIETAVNGAYDALQKQGQFGESIFYLFEVRSDNSEESSSLGQRGGAITDMDIFAVQPSNALLSSTWIDSYDGIQRCNAILNNIDKINMDASTKAIRKGEAQFLRALTYFNLVRIFGEVPLVITQTTDPFEAFGNGRDPVATIYNQIIIDLEAAANALPTNQSVVGKATKGAANALLGKVQLTLGNYPEAISALSNVSGYSLLPNYADLFGSGNENNAESIFEVQYSSGQGSSFVVNGEGSGLGEGSVFANQFAPFGGGSLVVNGSANGSNRPTKDLWNSYDQADLRRDVNIGDFGGILYPKKFVEPTAGPLDSDLNVIVLRYADVILMHAEALNEQGYVADGQAFDLVNQIRNRAGLADLTSATVTNQAEFRLAIENERRWELAFENHRWPDLVRTGRALEVINSHVTETSNIPLTLSISTNQLLYPIPQNEIDTNPALVQNPGY